MAINSELNSHAIIPIIRPQMVLLAVDANTAGSRRHKSTNERESQ